MEAGAPNRIVKATSGVKKFLATRLSKILKIFQSDEVKESGKERGTYLVEFDEKQPDKWEKVGNKWLRHHQMPRSTLFRPIGVASGPQLDDLSATRVTELIFPDGKMETRTDTWMDDDHGEADHITEGLWRGTTTFFVKDSQVQKFY